jgi:hypothetical protein
MIRYQDACYGPRSPARTAPGTTTTLGRSPSGERKDYKTAKRVGGATAGVLLFAILAHLVHLKVDGAVGLATGATPALFAHGRRAKAGVLLSAILAHLVHLKVDGAAGLAAGATPALFALSQRAGDGVLLSAILAHLVHHGEPTVL